MTTTTFNQARFDELTAKVEYSATFVPFSRSRSRDEKQCNLNWIVTLKSGRTEFSTDYSQGVGHIPYRMECRQSIDAFRIPESQKQF
jgi:hypothetical protein